MKNTHTYWFETARSSWKTRHEYKIRTRRAFPITKIYNLFISRLIKQRKHFTLPKGQLTVIYGGDVPMIKRCVVISNQFTDTVYQLSHSIKRSWKRQLYSKTVSMMIDTGCSCKWPKHIGNNDTYINICI